MMIVIENSWVFFLALKTLRDTERFLYYLAIMIIDTLPKGIIG